MFTEPPSHVRAETTRNSLRWKHLPETLPPHLPKETISSFLSRVAKYDQVSNHSQLQSSGEFPRITKPPIRPSVCSDETSEFHHLHRRSFFFGLRVRARDSRSIPSANINIPISLARVASASPPPFFVQGGKTLPPNPDIAIQLETGLQDVHPV